MVFIKLQEILKLFPLVVPFLPLSYAVPQSQIETSQDTIPPAKINDLQINKNSSQDIGTEYQQRHQTKYAEIFERAYEINQRKLSLEQTKKSLDSIFADYSMVGIDIKNGEFYFNAVITANPEIKKDELEKRLTKRGISFEILQTIYASKDFSPIMYNVRFKIQDLYKLNDQIEIFSILSGMNHYGTIKNPSIF